MEIIFLILFGFIFLGVFLVFKFGKKKKLSKEQINFFIKKLEFIKKIESKKEQIMDYDKLYHKILLEIGYKGTFAEILKSKPKYIDNLQNIWELHKTRNKLAHELDIIDDKTLINTSKNFEKEIFKLLKNIS